jgi:hypothetical protein
MRQKRINRKLQKYLFQFYIFPLDNLHFLNMICPVDGLFNRSGKNNNNKARRSP